MEINPHIFKIIPVGKDHAYFGVTLEDGAELCIEPCLSGFYVALYDKDNELLLPKRELFTNIPYEDFALMMSVGSVFRHRLLGHSVDCPEVKNGMLMSKHHLNLMNGAVRLAQELYEEYRSKK